MVVVQAQIQTVEDIGWVATMTERRGCFAISTVAKAARAVGVAGSPDNWRCMVPEKFRRVELVDAVWQTAPNHSRPQTCVVQLDVDAEEFSRVDSASEDRQARLASHSRALSP